MVAGVQVTYRNHSIRCRHGFCVESVGCEVCRIKPDRKAMLALRVPRERKRIEVPPGYGNPEGRKGNEGNSNARSRY